MDTESKSKLKQLLNKEGFTDILSTLGEIGKEEEQILKNESNSALSCSFTILLYLLADYYRSKPGRKKKKFIEQCLGSESIKESLKIVHWDSEAHCPAMKETYKLFRDFVK